MEKKGSKGLICLVVILILALLGTVGYILYDKDVFKLKKETQRIETKEIIEEDYDLDKAEELLKKFGLSKNMDETLVNGTSNWSWYSFYSNRYEDSYKRSVVLRKVLKSNNDLEKMKCTDWYSVSADRPGVCQLGSGILKVDDDMTLIPYDTANKVYKEMYGEDMGKVSVSLTSYGYYSFFAYNPSHDVFIPTECGGCGGTFGPNAQIYKIRSAKLENDELTINVYAQMLSGDTSFELGNEKIEVTSAENAEKEIMEKYLDKIDLYEITFEYDGDNFIYKYINKI